MNAGTTRGANARRVIGGVRTAVTVGLLTIGLAGCGSAVLPRPTTHATTTPSPTSTATAIDPFAAGLAAQLASGSCAPPQGSGPDPSSPPGAVSAILARLSHEGDIVVPGRTWTLHAGESTLHVVCFASMPTVQYDRAADLLRRGGGRSVTALPGAIVMSTGLDSGASAAILVAEPHPTDITRVAILGWVGQAPTPTPTP